MGMLKKSGEDISAACAVIRKQFPDTPEGKLCFAVVDLAIHDLDKNSHVDSAMAYLKGDIVHAQLCDIDPDWIRSLLKSLGIFDLDNFYGYLERTQKKDEELVRFIESQIRKGKNRLSDISRASRKLAQPFEKRDIITVLNRYLGERWEKNYVTKRAFPYYFLIKHNSL